MKTLFGGAAPLAKRTGFIKVAQRVWWNHTEVPQVLVEGYPTVANGYAAPIRVPAGECAYRATKGNARAFEKWVIGTYEEVSEAGADVLWDVLL